ATVASKTVEGLAVQVFAEAGKPGAELAFLDEGTLVAGTAGAVEAVITNHARRARPGEANASMLALVRGPAPSSGYWVAIDQPVIGRAQKEAGGSAPPFPLPRNLTIAGRFEGGLELAGEMADEAAAKSTVEMLQQGLEMGKAQLAQASELPQSAEL